MLDFSSLVSLLCAAIAYLLLIAVKHVYFSSLSQFPGPKWAALTLWNEFYWDVIKRGTFIWKIEEMHKKYGQCHSTFMTSTTDTSRSHRPHQSI